MSKQPEQSIDATIVAAVNARVEASVAAALAGDEIIGSMVTATLMQQVPKGDRYSRETETFLNSLISQTIKKATESAVKKVIAEEVEAIEAAVATEIRRNVKTFASKLAGGLGDIAEKAYGVTVQINTGSER